MKGMKIVDMEMKFTLPEPDVALYEVTRVLEESDYLSHDALLKCEKTNYDERIYKSLHKIAKLPQVINPQNSSRLCGYKRMEENSSKDLQAKILLMIKKKNAN